eukprot:gene13762-biopygen12577
MSGRTSIWYERPDVGLKNNSKKVTLFLHPCSAQLLRLSADRGGEGQRPRPARQRPVDGGAGCGDNCAAGGAVLGNLPILHTAFSGALAPAPGGGPDFPDFDPEHSGRDGAPSGRAVRRRQCASSHATTHAFQGCPQIVESRALPAGDGALFVTPGPIWHHVTGRHVTSRIAHVVTDSIRVGSTAPSLCW